MDSETRIPPFKEPNSLVSWRCCLFSFISFFFILLSSSILFILFFLKPKKPTFLLHSIHFDPIKLDASSEKGVFLQASMASMPFAAQNFNKFGIRYSPSRLGIMYESNPIGVVNVPGFYQPPNSQNVTVIMHALLQRVNISRFVSSGSSSNGARAEVRITGIVGVRIHIINFSFPAIKVGLDCSIKLDYGAEMLGKGVMSMKTNKALVLSKLPHFYQKCLIAL